MSTPAELLRRMARIVLADERAGGDKSFRFYLTMADRTNMSPAEVKALVQVMAQASL